MSGTDLFDEIVRLSGLSPIFARTVIQRAASRAGLDVQRMARADVQRLLPELQRAFSVYLGHDADNRIGAIRRLGDA